MSTRLKGRTPLAKGAGFLEEFTKDEVKAKVDILSLMESFGISLEKKGSSWMGLCPFHEDKNPSLSVDASKGLYHCFGCGEGGDVFELVMKRESLDFPGALKYLKGVTNTSVTRAIGPSTGDTSVTNTSEAVSAIGGGGAALLEAVADSYRKDLFASRKAQNYLKRRCLFNCLPHDHLRIGFSEGKLPERTGEHQQRELTEEGLLTTEGREFFTGCVTVALSNLEGQITGFYGRRTTGGSPSHLYLKGPHRGLLNPRIYRAYPERVIWTESVFDALSLMSLGFANTDALFGTGGLTDTHLQALKEGRTKEVVLALDNDEAGRKAAKKLTENLTAQGVSVRRIVPPSHLGEKSLKDWNDYLKAVGEKEAIDRLIEEAPLHRPAGVTGTGAIGTGSTAGGAGVVQEREGRYTARMDEILYHIIGVREGFLSSLKVNIRAELIHDEKEGPPSRKHIDNVDLFSSRSRTLFAANLSRLLETEAAQVERHLVAILEYLETEQEKALSATGAADTGIPPMSDEDEERSLRLPTRPPPL